MKGDRSEGWADPKAGNRSVSWNADREERISYHLGEHPIFLPFGLIQCSNKTTSQLGFCEEV